MPVPPRSGQGHLNLLVRSKPPAKTIESPLRGNLLEGGLRSNRMPHEGFADPITSDETRFCSNMPISELTEHDTRAIEASVVSSAPPVVESKDGVTHETRPTPTEPHGARWLEPSNPRSRDQGSKASSRRARGQLASSKSQGGNVDEPQRPLPV